MASPSLCQVTIHYDTSKIKTLNVTRCICMLKYELTSWPYWWWSVSTFPHLELSWNVTLFWVIWTLIGKDGPKESLIGCCVHKIMHVCFELEVGCIESDHLIEVISGNIIWEVFEPLDLDEGTGFLGLMPIPASC